MTDQNPAAVPVPPPADQTALRDRIRRAICEAEGFGWDTDMLEPDEYGEVADAVLAVLPEQTALPLTAVERQFLTFALGLAADEMASRGSEFGEDDEAALEKLRRVAAEEQPAETQHRPVSLSTCCARCPHPYNWHASWGGCQFGNEVNRCGCGAFVPGERPEPVDPRSILGIDAEPERPAVGEQPETQETRPCGNEHPGSGFALGVRCTLEEHSGDHGRDEEIPGTGHTVRLRWPNRERP